MTDRRDIVTGWLVCMLTFAAADQLWTLWEIPSDGKAVKVNTGLEYQRCEWLAGVLSWRTEIMWDIITRAPAKSRYRCRQDGEEPE